MTDGEFFATFLLCVLHFVCGYLVGKNKKMETWQTPEYKARYWEEKKLQHQRGQDFINAVKPGDVVRIERYSITNDNPYSLSKYANIHTTQTVKIYAVHANDAHPWFTIYGGEAIQADSVIKWHKVPQQQSLGL